MRRRDSQEAVESKVKKDGEPNGGKNPSTKISKNYEGWNHSWAAPNRIQLENGLAVRDVVPGPFISPRLVKVTPFVVNSSNQVQKVDKIRQGIPDAWAEYLAVNGFGSEVDQKIIEKELALGYNNLRVTDFVWNELGLPLTQGIPDPWKSVLSDNESSLDDDEVDLCLCDPTIRKEKEVPRKIKKRKCKKKMKDCKESGSKNRNSCLEESNNIIQCELSGKITLNTQQGKSFDGVGFLKLNCGQNGNNVCGKQEKESHQFLPDFAHNVYNQFSKSSKIRGMVSNFEPKKQFSKLKKMLNGKKRERMGKKFGEETKLVCCKCSCPYFKVLADEQLIDETLFQETSSYNIDKSCSNPKSKTRKKVERKTRKNLHGILSDSEKKREKKHGSERRIEKSKLIENANPVKKKGEKNLKNEVECGCVLRRVGDSIGSGNDADISDSSKRDNLTPRDTLELPLDSLISMTSLNKQLSEILPREPKIDRKKEKRKKHKCSPCGKKLPRNLRTDDDWIKIGTSDLTQELSNQNYNQRKVPQDRKIDRRRSVSYASDVDTEPREKNKLERRILASEKNRQSQPTWDRNFEKQNSNNDDLEEENLSTNSNQKTRKRGGGMEIESLSSESDFDELDFPKSAWSEREENKSDSSKKIGAEQDRSNLGLDNEIPTRVFSLLEESLDLISEPIGRKKSSDNFKNSTEKSPKNESKCYVKYCYDRARRNNFES